MVKLESSGCFKYCSATTMVTSLASLTIIKKVASIVINYVFSSLLKDKLTIWGYGIWSLSFETLGALINGYWAQLKAHKWGFVSVKGEKNENHTNHNDKRIQMSTLSTKSTFLLLIVMNMFVFCFQKWVKKWGNLYWYDTEW